MEYNTDETEENEISFRNYNMNLDIQPLKLKAQSEEIEVFSQLKLFKEWGQKRIMVVDDEEICLAIMKTIFSSCGFNNQYEIDYCINGHECVDKVIEAYEHGMTYAMIFTDVSMPVLNGIDATKKIRHFL